MDKTTLKQWFSKGKKPLASHFATWIDSFWHKDEQIPITAISDLDNVISGFETKPSVDEKLSLKAEKEHVHDRADITDFEHVHKLKDIEDYKESNIFDTIESMPPRSTWFETDMVPETITFHLSNARLFRYYEGANEEQYLCFLEDLTAETESGRIGLKIDMTEILSTGRFILKFHLSRYGFAKYIERVIFRHKYQVPNIKGNCCESEQYYSNYVDIEGDSILFVKRNIESVIRLFASAPGEEGLFSEDSNLYCKGLNYGNAVAYVIDTDHREYSMTGFMYSTPYFMHSSQENPGFRCYRYPTEPIFGLFPLCVLQTAYIDNNNDFCMVFAKHRDASSDLPLDPIIPDVTFDLLLDKKAIEEAMQNQDII